MPAASMGQQGSGTTEAGSVVVKQSFSIILHLSDWTTLRLMCNRSRGPCSERCLLSSLYERATWSHGRVSNSRATKNTLRGPISPLLSGKSNCIVVPLRVLPVFCPAFLRFSHLIEYTWLRLSLTFACRSWFVQELCLQIKSLQLGSIVPFLSKALEPPSPQTVQNAIDLLCTIGAMDSEAEELTPLGWHLAGATRWPTC